MPVHRRAILIAALSCLGTQARGQQSAETAAVRIYVVPMSDFPEQFASQVAGFLTDELGFTVRSTLRLGDLGIQAIPGTHQIPADQILEESIATLRNFPGASASTYFLLLTARDINTTTLRTRFVFSWHNPTLNVSVLSVARLLEFDAERPRLGSTFFGRLFKMSKRAVGELHLGWKRTIDRNDLMFAPIQSLDDIDRLGTKHVAEKLE